MVQIRRILVPVDFTEYSRRAADYAAEIARLSKARIVLLHVIERFSYSVTDTIQVVDHSPALMTIARPLMESQKKRLVRKGVKADALIVKGIPYREIIEQARRSRSDLIVMGTLGRTGLEHLLLGSVAEKVVRLSPCPVVTVRSSIGMKGARKTGGSAKARRHR